MALLKFCGVSSVKKLCMIKLAEKLTEGDIES
ncbi:MAG: hypothetical protein XD95_0285 [Microgenomates bacterium 39_7]|nr:MAG: hypothetical protein XD95_0285 [Microgenomates bacterium 39_7]